MRTIGILAVLIAVLGSACSDRPGDGEVFQIVSASGPAQLDVRIAGNNSIRVTISPIGLSDLPYSPALSNRAYSDPVISLRELSYPVTRNVGQLSVEVAPNPLTVRVSSSSGRVIQNLVFESDGTLSFELDDAPILGLGEGGPLPGRDTDWRTHKVEFDRRGRFHNMQPRWQADMYGSRNPVAMLVGTGGWGLFVSTPWGQLDLSDPDRGMFFPVKPADPDSMRQNHGNQQESLGKGIPPMESLVPGVYDVFVFDADDPSAFMKDVSMISGPSVMPPKWALGYMQSHRTLEDDAQLLRIVDTFRQKEIPVDAVIYLGTGFTPQGWNTEQPSFDFNPEVFKRAPAAVLEDLHERNVKVSVHMVPWDRDRLPVLYGSIPAITREALRPGHIASYWQEHIPLVNAGVDAWWPDEGDWFDLFERIKRHQIYYEGPLSTQPNTRPWSLHRNGHLGVAKWGGWVWSGDTDASWKSLEAQVAVGINHSLSLSPFWGSDIGGFFSNEELTGELYTRWFQFGAFCPSFRSHGRTWWRRLPWGWGLTEMGPLETRTPPLESELNNPSIEPIVKQYAELRYQLLPYNYTLAWEARDKGLPMMRALWLHYPNDLVAGGRGDEYLWGRDLLIAPIFEDGAASRDVYLPAGDWYDWWTNERLPGGQTVTKEVDLATMPIFVRAGAIIPIDPVRQYTGQAVNEPTTIKVFAGADGSFTLYEDDGESLNYLNGEATLTRFTWNDDARRLSIEPVATEVYAAPVGDREFQIQILPGGDTKLAGYDGSSITIEF